MADQYTRKSQEALAGAQAAAQAAGHPELLPAHLAVALLAEPEGVMSALLEKLEVDPRVLATEVCR
jgi:ATP-dependent Clp protease ATP-binding subunit ClpB